LTGNPGIGKTTVLMKIVDVLKTRGFKVGGMITREVREVGERVGFEILDLNSSKRGWLAQVNIGTGPRVGRYRINLKDLEEIGAKSILDAARHAEVVVIDEIGPLELFSNKFRVAVQKAMLSHKPVVAVIHWKTKEALINEVKAREDAEIFAVTYANREDLIEVVLSQLQKPFTQN
jgi:nucleoside-triphosphatase